MRLNITTPLRSSLAVGRKAACRAATAQDFVERFPAIRPDIFQRVDGTNVVRDITHKIIVFHSKARKFSQLSYSRRYISGRSDKKINNWRRSLKDPIHSGIVPTKLFVSTKSAPAENGRVSP
jgi:hypothetical protein